MNYTSYFVGVCDGACAQGTMEFGGTGFVQDSCGVFCRDACSAEYCDSATGCSDEFLKQGDALPGSRLLAGCEDAVASETDNLVECLEGIVADVKGAVEGNADLSVALTGILYHLRGLCEIYVSVGGECPDDYAVGSELQCRSDICTHLVQFLWGIDEIACTGPYEDVHADTCGMAEGYCLAYRLWVGGHAVLLEVTAEFNALCSALYGCTDAWDIAAAYFQYHVIGRIVSRLHLHFSRCHRGGGRYGRSCRSCGR